jgi:hypothetical protein
VVGLQSPPVQMPPWHLPEMQSPPESQASPSGVSGLLTI